MSAFASASFSTSSFSVDAFSFDVVSQVSGGGIGHGRKIRKIYIEEDAWQKQVRLNNKIKKAINEVVAGEKRTASHVVQEMVQVVTPFIVSPLQDYKPPYVDWAEVEKRSGIIRILINLWKRQKELEEEDEELLLMTASLIARM